MTDYRRLIHDAWQELHMGSGTRARWAAWLDPAVAASDVLGALPKDSLDVTRVYQPTPAQAALL